MLLYRLFEIFEAEILSDYIVLHREFSFSLLHVLLYFSLFHLLTVASSSGKRSKKVHDKFAIASSAALSLLIFIFWGFCSREFSLILHRAFLDKTNPWLGYEQAANWPNLISR